MGNFFHVVTSVMAGLVISATPAMAPAPEPNPVVVKLQEFLDEKHSPLPAEELSKYDNWEMIVALSAAESGYGKYLGGDFNAWGIKDFRAGSKNFAKTRDFTSWEESIKYTSELLYKYDEEGKPTPQGMVSKWKVVLPYQHWVNNVSYSLYDIKKNIKDNLV